MVCYEAATAAPGAVSPSQCPPHPGQAPPVHTPATRPVQPERPKQHSLQTEQSNSTHTRVQPPAVSTGASSTRSSTGSSTGPRKGDTCSGQARTQALHVPHQSTVTAAQELHTRSRVSHTRPLVPHPTTRTTPPPTHAGLSLYRHPRMCAAAGIPWVGATRSSARGAYR